MNENIEYRIKLIISDVLNIDINEIHDTSSPRSVPEWKGINHRKIIEELQKEFGIIFDESEIDTLVNFRIIKATVIAHLE